jgi:tellurite resistance protein TerC
MLLGVIGALLLFDILVVHRRPHVAHVKEAAIESAVWVGIGVGFTFVIWWMFERAAAVEYISGYLIEKSLSVDNVFVWAMIFTHFKVPRQYQHRTLFWGIFGALIMRFVFILLGVAIIERFDYVLIGFGLFLVYTGVGVLRHGGEDDANPSDTRTMRLFHRFVPTTDELDGQKLWTVNELGKRVATPLLAVLVLVEITDVIFAVDSVPAVFTITTDPFIVYTSNIFAILGLRALYFALAAVLHRFHYLKYALAILLIFIGSKIFVADLAGWEKFPASWSLGITFAILAAGVIFSLWKSRGNETAPLDVK